MKVTAEEEGLTADAPDWRARPTAELDATDDSWLFFFGHPREHPEEWEAYRKRVRAEVDRRLGIDRQQEDLFGDIELAQSLCSES